MTKKLKLYIIGFISLLMVASWAFIFFNGYIGQTSNNMWQAAMGFTALVFGLLGMFTAKQWGWFKSNVGRSVFFLSLGILFWGIGQSYWTYFLFVDPETEIPQSYLMDIILISVIPIWFYGILSLAKATGAKYGFKDAGGALIGVMFVIFMSMFSYFTLVLIARDGTLFSEDQTTWQSLFDIAYPIGDAILLTLSMLIFVFSWNYLGGRFKKQILLILAAFVMLFVADFSFSYTDGNETYYNGSVVDLFFIIMVVLFGLGVSMLDPRRTWSKERPMPQEAVPEPINNNNHVINNKPAATGQPTFANTKNSVIISENPKTVSDTTNVQDQLTPPVHDAEYLHQPNPEYQQERQQ